MQGLDREPCRNPIRRDNGAKSFDGNVVEQVDQPSKSDSGGCASRRTLGGLPFSEGDSRHRVRSVDRDHGMAEQEPPLAFTGQQLVPW